MAEFTLGDQMPNFQLNATDGTTFDFHQFQQTHPNQWYFVINFRGSWCPVCMEELDSLIKNVGYFEKKNIQIILTSNDTAENLRQMVEEKQVPYPVLLSMKTMILRILTGFIAIQMIRFMMTTGRTMNLHIS